LKPEQITRKELIDLRLKKAGWNVGDFSQVVEEFNVKTDAKSFAEPYVPYGNQFIDYVLLGKDGKPLANAKDPFVTEKLLQRVYGNQHAKFLQFVRHILHIEVIHSFEETVTSAFDEFIRLHSNLSNSQIEFMVVLKKYLIDKGRIEKKDLTNPPFTQLHPQGILGIFSPKEIEEIITVIHRIAA
jgi:type I site-specific restriction endonuclease